MPSPIIEVMRIIAEDWVATTPPDQPEREYSYASDELVDANDQLAHRSFWFEAPERGEPVGEAGDTTQVEYTLKAVLVLDSDGYRPSDFSAAIANEQSLLMRAIETRSDWTDGGAVSGIWWVLTEGSEVLLLEEAGNSVLVTFNLKALVGED